MTIFEDNFVYPFPDTMYDPLIRVRVRISSFRDADRKDVPISIYYDPEIEPDHLTLPVPEEIKEIWRSRAYSRNKASDETIRFPFKSKKQVKIDNQPCRWEAKNNIIRLKIRSGSETFKSVERQIRRLDIGFISEAPLDFLAYVYRNYIRLSGLADQYYTKEICPNANLVQICLSSDAFLNAFKLSPANYTEVESGWYCIASRELVR